MLKTYCVSPKTIGADIEFGISETALMSLKTELDRKKLDELEEPFGVDGAGDIPEIRIEPEKTADKLVANTKKVLETGLTKFPFLARSVWSPFHFNSPTGFHIHFGNIDEELGAEGSDYDINNFILTLDKYLVLPTLQLSKEAINVRKRRGYGKLGDYRESDISEGIEYRTLPSVIMATPEITEAVFNVAIKLFTLWWEKKLPKINSSEKARINEIYNSNSFYASELMTRQIRKQLIKLAPELKESIKVFYNRKIRKVPDIKESWGLNFTLVIPTSVEILKKTREMIDTFNSIRVANDINSTIQIGSDNGFLIPNIVDATKRLFTLLNYLPSKYHYALIGAKKERGKEFLTDINENTCSLYIPYELRTKLSNEKLIFEITKAIIGIDTNKTEFKKIKMEKEETTNDDNPIDVFNGDGDFTEEVKDAVYHREKGETLSSIERLLISALSTTQYHQVVDILRGAEEL